ncbi:Uncharacterized protein HZ326_18450 [Fusarium oxysporum f. sp. albedinis]|nr:Uncharacterized protein HZ326_18450 [Fusarium oxysporum f. sp. albedinis]
MRLPIPTQTGQGSWQGSWKDIQGCCAAVCVRLVAERKLVEMTMMGASSTDAVVEIETNMKMGYDVDQASIRREWWKAQRHAGGPHWPVTNGHCRTTNHPLTECSVAAEEEPAPPIGSPWSMDGANKTTPGVASYAKKRRESKEAKSTR